MTDKTKQEGQQKKQRKKPKKTLLFIGLGVVVVLAGLLLLFSFKHTEAYTTSYTVSYALIIDNQTVKQDNITFMQGKLSSLLGLMSTKLDDAVASMQVGDEITLTLNASEAFGEYDESKRITVNRTNNLERKSEIDKFFYITLDKFVEVFNEQPIVGNAYSTQGLRWQLKVVEVNDSLVKLEHLAKIGDTMPLGFLGLTQKVIGVTSDKIILEIEGQPTSMETPNGVLEVSFDDDYVYFTLTPEIGQEVELNGVKGRVVEITNDSIVVDANPLYAGKQVVIKLKLLAKQKVKASISASCVYHPNAPTMQVFIMSYCPFGLQMVKGLLPVWKLLGDKANIELRFVSYTMHGPKEEEENKRMICIREEQCDKLITYLECFAGSGDWEKCIAQAGIDKAKLEQCMQFRAENYFKVDKQLNEKYGVRGSPTVVINGKVVEIWPRSPENIKQELCKAFANPPEECNQQLSTQNPSPGFGYGTSSAGGSCA